MEKGILIDDPEVPIGHDNVKRVISHRDGLRDLAGLGVDPRDRALELARHPHAALAGGHAAGIPADSDRREELVGRGIYALDGVEPRRECRF